MRTLLARYALGIPTIAALILALFVGFAFARVIVGESGAEQEVVQGGRCLTYTLPTTGEERQTCFSGEAPDEFWYVPLVEAEDVKPRLDTTVNGIRIGPGLERGDTFCDSIDAASADERGQVDFARTRSSEIAINPVFPREAVLVRGEAAQCGGVVNHVEAEYFVTPDLSIPRWGGPVVVIRSRDALAAGLSFPSDRASAEAIAGYDAVLLRPITTDGFGPSAVIVKDEFGLTIIEAEGLTADEVLAVARSLYE